MRHSTSKSPLLVSNTKMSKNKKKYPFKKKGGKSSDQKNKPEYMFHPSTLNSGNQRNAPFDLVKEKLARKVQIDLDQGGVIAEAILELKDLSFATGKPTLQAASTVVPAEDKADYEDKKKEYDRECRELDMEYMSELKDWKKKKETYAENQQTVYATILDDYCTTTMQSRLKDDPKWSTVRNNPVELLS